MLAPAAVVTAAGSAAVAAAVEGSGLGFVALLVQLLLQQRSSSAIERGRVACRRLYVMLHV